MYAATVEEPVDRHIARLVDAINRSSYGVRSTGSCSGHTRDSMWPYLAFRARGWKFVKFVLHGVTALNAVTGGSTHIDLYAAKGRELTGVIHLHPYLQSWRPRRWKNPPLWLVHLWWVELDALAEMVERATVQPPSRVADSFATLVERQRSITAQA